MGRSYSSMRILVYGLGPFRREGSGLRTYRAWIGKITQKRRWHMTRKLGATDVQGLGCWVPLLAASRE